MISETWVYYLLAVSISRALAVPDLDTCSFTFLCAIKIKVYPKFGTALSLSGLIEHR